MWPVLYSTIQIPASGLCHGFQSPLPHFRKLLRLSSCLRMAWMRHEGCVYLVY
jgi:hypothetical protein